MLPSFGASVVATTARLMQSGAMAILAAAAGSLEAFQTGFAEAPTSSPDTRALHPSRSRQPRHIWSSERRRAA
jgi:hypothetical protein